jgi:hypothetical protein
MKPKEGKKTISSLEEDGRVFSDNDSMLKHAVQFYKKLFSKEHRENIRLDEGFWDEDQDKILPEENELLEAELTEKC